MSLQDYQEGRPSYKHVSKYLFLYASGTQWKVGIYLGGTSSYHNSGGEWANYVPPSSIVYYLAAGTKSVCEPWEEDWTTGNTPGIKVECV